MCFEGSSAQEFLTVAPETTRLTVAVVLIGRSTTKTRRQSAAFKSIWGPVRSLATPSPATIRCSVWKLSPEVISTTAITRAHLAKLEPSMWVIFGASNQFHDLVETTRSPAISTRQPFIQVDLGNATGNIVFTMGANGSGRPSAYSSVGTDTFLSGVRNIVSSNGNDTYNASAFTGPGGSYNFFQGMGGNDTITGNFNTVVVYTQRDWKYRIHTWRKWIRNGYRR